MPQPGLEVLNQQTHTPSQNCNRFSTVVPSKPLPAALVLVFQRPEREVVILEGRRALEQPLSKALWAARGHSSAHPLFFCENMAMSKHQKQGTEQQDFS